jgi:hypothetical protein
MSRVVDEAHVRLQARLADIGGCGDGDCKVVRPIMSMHTNGGCRCLSRTSITAQQVVQAYRTFVAEVTEEKTPQ